MDKGKVKEILLFQSTRNVANLYKRFLTVLESNRNEHRIMLNKLIEGLPPEHHHQLVLADYFNNDKFTYLRKQVLDAGNDCIRELENIIDNLEIDFKHKE